MPLVISGKLSLPITGQPAANAEIRFRAINAVGEVIPGAEAVGRCAADGSYNISIEYNRYELATRVSTVDFVVHGKLTIDSETIAKDVEDLINIIGLSSDNGGLTDELIRQFQQLKLEAEQAADRAEAAASKTDAALPGLNYFESNYPTFETNYNDFSTKYPDVVAKHGEVVTLASQASDDAVLAGKWASLPEDSEVEPGKYSALHWAAKAQYNANQTFISGGLFAPKSGAEYPDVSGVVRDTIWIVSFDSQGDTYTFTGGQLAGKATSNADMMFYDTPTNTWNLIKTSVTGGSGVLSVDGDTGPNVNLESKYFWANNRPSIADVDNLQVELNKKLGKTEKAASAAISDRITIDDNHTYGTFWPVPWHNNAGVLYDTDGKFNFQASTGTLKVTRILEGKERVFSKANKPSIADVTSLQVELNEKYSDSNKPLVSDVSGLQQALDAKEPSLGNPSQDGMVLSSTKAGVRSWVAGGGQEEVDFNISPVGSGFVDVPDITQFNRIELYAKSNLYQSATIIRPADVLTPSTEYVGMVTAYIDGSNYFYIRIATADSTATRLKIERGGAGGGSNAVYYRMVGFK